MQRCIESISVQIEKYDLAKVVGIYVANDTSPDNTAQLLTEFESLEFFRCVNRETNLGMSLNIKSMLGESLEFSTFQLIITDDDYLVPGTLGEIVEFLADLDSSNRDVSLIWTPRYSYLENGQLQTIVCETFPDDQLVLPSYRNAGRHMYNGFVLSGLIVKAREIDFSFWDEYQENAYFPVIFSGEMMLRNPSMYWNRSIVYHSVLNECHWDRWGQSDAEITLRLFIDYLNAYVVIANRLKSAWRKLFFYISAFPRAFQMSNSLVITSGGFCRLSDTESVALLNIGRVSFARLESPAGILLFFIMVRILFSCLVRVPVIKALIFISTDGPRRKKRLESYDRLKQWLFNAKFIIRWVG